MVTPTFDRTTSVVRFDVVSSSNELSSQIASALLDLVNDFNLRRRQSQARAEREFVERSAVRAKLSLDSLEELNVAFHRQNRDIAGSPALQAEQARLLRQLTLRQQVYLTLSQNLELARIDEVRSTPVVTVLERPQYWPEPVARGTVRKAIVGTLAGTFFTVLLIFGLEFVAAARRESSGGYEEFVSELRAVLPSLGPWRRSRDT
jgi:uncharacterized protein involved in exopolysaccharide biosynthesis